MFPPPAGSFVALVFAISAFAAVVIAVALAARTPLLWRIVRREVVRRPGRSGTMVVGLCLSTVFLTAAFGLQDSFRRSAIDYRLAQVGSVDEAVTGALTPSQISHTLAVLNRSRDVGAVTDLYMSVAATLAPAQSRGAPTNSYLYGVRPGFESVYGPLTDQHGHAVKVSDLGAGEVILSRSAAQRSGVHTGERVAFAWDQVTVTATVAAVLDNDPVVTTGELNQDTAVASVIAPLDTIEHAFTRQYHSVLPPDTICVRNARSGGDASRAVISVLQQLFGVKAIDPASPHGTFAPTYFDETLIHPLQPTVVDYTGGLSQVSSKVEYTSSPAARQANWLQPAFAILLVAAGLLLLALQCVLLALERRAELGMSRAQGLQRRQIVEGMAIEGCVYATIAALIGVPLGALATAGEISLLNRLPNVSLGGSAPFQFADIAFHATLRWQSALLAGALGLLVALIVVALAAAAVSRTTVITAQRDLGSARRRPASLTEILRAVGLRRSGTGARDVSETRARRRERRADAARRLLVDLTVRGPLPLAGGTALVLIARTEGTPSTLGLTLVSAAGVRALGIGLLIGGGGVLCGVIAIRCHAHVALARRLTITVLGAGWLVYGLATGEQLFREMFAANLADTGTSHTGPFSILGILLDLLLPLAGAFVIVIRNADISAVALTAVMRRIRPLRPISRISLAHPLTFRGRTAVTITLLGSVTFLIMLLVASNADIASHSQGGGPYTAILTEFLTAYLALGLLFGAVAIGVIANRAVAERRQEIGMLRALGFPRRLVRLAFIVETSFVTALGLGPATLLAWALLTETAHLNHEHPAFPIRATALLLAGAFVIAALAVAIPAYRASRIPPATALRVD